MTVPVDDPDVTDDESPWDEDAQDEDAGVADGGNEGDWGPGDPDADFAGVGFDGGVEAGLEEAGMADAAADWGEPDGAADWGPPDMGQDEDGDAGEAASQEPAGPDCDQAPQESRSVSVEGGSASFDVTSDGYQLVRGPGQTGGEAHARFDDSRDDQGHDLNGCPGNLAEGWQEAVDGHQSQPEPPEDHGGEGAGMEACDGVKPLPGEMGYGSADGMSHDHEAEQGLSDPCGGEAYYDVPDEVDGNYSEEVMSQDPSAEDTGAEGGMCEDESAGTADDGDMCHEDGPMSY